MKKYKFPKDFLWGSGTAALQIEGKIDIEKRELDKWEFWYSKSRYRFYEEKFCENNFYENYKKDIKLAKEAGMNSLRISILMARVFNKEGKLNKNGVAFYHKVIDEIILNNMEPIISLNHYDMPMHLEEEGGLLNKKFIKVFYNYSKKMFIEYGQKVKKWFTFNEPGYVFAAYLNDIHYPNIRDMSKALQAQYNIIMCHHNALKAFHEVNIPNGDIGMVLNISKAIPRDSRNKFDQEAAEFSNIFDFEMYLDSDLKGSIPRKLYKILASRGIEIKTEPGDDALIKKYSSTILGFNFYQPHRVKAPTISYKVHNGDLGLEHFFEKYNMPGIKITKDRGREVYPKAVYDTLINIKDTYNNIKVMICENGLGIMNEERFKKNDVIQDDYRIDFFGEHIAWINKAIEEGSNCIGYHIWTYIDNWSWINAYKNRYGIYELDLLSKERKPKKSKTWLKNVFEKNELEWRDLNPDEFK